MSRSFLYVGNWGFHPAPKGISVFSYEDKTGVLTLLETIMPEIAAGQLYLDEPRKTLYAVNECGERPGECGGGGELLSFKINADTGRLTLLNRRDSLCPEPSYLCPDGTGQYIMTCHCADVGHVTKIVKNADGTLSNQVLFDDASVVLFRLNADGSIGDAIDHLSFPGQNKLDERHQINVDPVTGHSQYVEIISRLHAVLASPDGNMFVACDKGLDKIYAFKLDRSLGLLTLTDTFEASWKSFPRYAAFHPALPLLYANSEFSSEVNVLRYDSAAGTMEHIATVSATDRDYGLVDGKPVGAQDILVNPDGTTMYVSTCGINSISVFALDEFGIPSLRQLISSRGDLPRGLALSPDGRRLLSGNMVSGDITVFSVEADGTLTDTAMLFEAVSPSAMKFFPAK